MGLTANKQRIAIEALVSIASKTRIECLTTKVTDDKALLQEANEITFSDKDMEAGYSDHRRPLYLVAFINQTPPQESLNGYGCFHKPHPTEYLTSCRNFKQKDLGMPSGSNRIWGKMHIPQAIFSCG